MYVYMKALEAKVIAAACVAFILALTHSCGSSSGGKVVSGGPAATVNDGAGDALFGQEGQGARPIDMVSIELTLNQVGQGEVVVVIRFDESEPFVSPSQALENSLGGMLDVQVGDANGTSELSGPVHWFGRNLDCFNCGVRRTHTVDLFSEFQHKGMLRVETATGKMAGFASVSYGGSSVTVRIPFDVLSDRTTSVTCRVSAIVSDNVGVTDVLDSGYAEVIIPAH